MLREKRIKLIGTILGSLIFILVIGLLVTALELDECKNLKESYKKAATGQHVSSYRDRNTLYEESKGAFAIREIEYTVAIDFLWTKKGDRLKNKRVKSTYMKIPVLGKTSAVGDAILSLDIKKLKKCRDIINKERDKAYCLVVETGTYADEKQLNPYVLSQWIPSKYKHGYGCVTISTKDGKTGLKKVECP